MLSGTPEVASLKTDYVITATDGVFTATATITVTVNTVVTPPSQPRVMAKVNTPIDATGGVDRVGVHGSGQVFAAFDASGGSVVEC